MLGIGIRNVGNFGNLCETILNGSVKPIAACEVLVPFNGDYGEL